MLLQIDEQKWRKTSDPVDMLSHLLGQVTSWRNRLYSWFGDRRLRVLDRKLRLFACACWRLRSWQLLSEEGGRKAVETSERYADGLATDQELRAARRRIGQELAALAGDMGQGDQWLAVSPKACQAIYEAWEAATWAQALPGSVEEFRNREWHAAQRQEFLCALLRDIFGPWPYHSVTMEPSWRTPAVLALAQVIYDQRSFERLPKLAQFLEAAGCTDPDLLDHLRGPGPHVRGCWVLDAVLAKV